MGVNENKARQVFRKTNISFPLIRTLTYMELGQKHEKELAVELEKKNKKRKVLLEKKEFNHVFCCCM